MDEENASKAAQAMTSYEDRFNRVDITLANIRGDIKLVQWMGGIIIVALVIPLVKGMF